jgi:ATP-independent RNA helicase DbpA
MFTATLTRAVKVISTRLQSEPATVVVQPDVQKAQITQLIYATGRLDRMSALERILGHHQPSQAVIFCGQRATCDNVVAALAESGYAAVALHGGMDQRDRERVLMRFASGSVRWLVATDVAARGIDIPDLPAVINYELPNDPDSYTHRIGRTGRAGREGLAISIVDPRRERRLIALAAPQFKNVEPAMAGALPVNKELPTPAPRATLSINAGERDRLRTEDIHAALVELIGLQPDQIGSITMLPKHTYVAVNRDMATRVIAGISGAPVKKLKLRASQVD